MADPFGNNSAEVLKYVQYVERFFFLLMFSDFFSLGSVPSPVLIKAISKLGSTSGSQRGAGRS